VIAWPGEQGASTWWQHSAQCLWRDGNASRSLAQDINAGLGWWWADPAAGYVLVFYATREVLSIFTQR